jgi:hypothetical protein
MLEDMWRHGEAPWRIWDGAGAETFAHNTSQHVSRAG